MGNVILLVLLPSLSAWLFLNLTPLFKFHFKYVAAHRQIFWVIICGLILNFLSFVLIEIHGYLISSLNEDSYGKIQGVHLYVTSVIKSWYQLAPEILPHDPNTSIQPLYIVNFTLVVFFIALSGVFKCCFKSHYEKFLKSRIRNAMSVHGKDDGFTKIFTNSLDDPSLIMITLKSRKVYIGMVISEPALLASSSKETVTLLLFASGYRDNVDMTVHLKNNYLDILEELAAEKDVASKEARAFERGIVISIDEIISVVPWIDKVHDLASETKSNN